ncbi:MAG TPA: GspE/PulE family protein [Coxiellaceae bacterium]|nr:GspE/PulE family protein [Coxiellaceae bacterium]
MSINWALCHEYAELISSYHILPLQQTPISLLIASDKKLSPETRLHVQFLTQRYITCVIKETPWLKKMLQHVHRHLDLWKDLFKEPLNTLINLALQHRASDIHLEPTASSVRLRFRIDGELSEQTQLPLSVYPYLVNQIKTAGRLDIAEKRRPQDGRIYFQSLSAPVRISTCPTSWGEKIVIRLFNFKPGDLSLTHLGLLPLQHTLFQQALKKSQGLILVTGPTGSGKTVTLYAALTALKHYSLNIVTAEDPIEIDMDGIQQTAVKPELGLTFSALLRTFLRQDPDVIMVGEIRDSETAQMAVKAAQTGHLVLATLHTHRATHSLIRLLQLGVPAYYLAESLNLVITQRLVKKYSGPGRIGVFEILSITPDIAALLMNQATAEHIEQHALKNGFLTLKQTLLEKSSLNQIDKTEAHRLLGELE